MTERKTPAEIAASIMADAQARYLLVGDLEKPIAQAIQAERERVMELFVRGLFLEVFITNIKGEFWTELLIGGDPVSSVRGEQQSVEAFLMAAQEAQEPGGQAGG